MNKKGFEASFGWVFALIVGAVIIFLAIFVASKVISTGQQGTDLKGAKDIGIILNPLETGVESQSGNYFVMPVETRIWNKCSEGGDFGEQGIQIQQKSFNEWSNTAGEVEFENKYIFSKEIVEGEKFYVFSRPFEFPFKVADVMIITSEFDRYCFSDAPSDVERDLESLNQENIVFEDCGDGDVEICFRGSCDIEVSANGGYVEKENERLYFDEETLMYAAIFSDPEVYECQTNRLMKKVEALSQLYIDKEKYLKAKNCNSNVVNELTGLKSAAGNYESSVNLNFVSNLAEDLGDKNDANAQCPLW